MNINRACRQMYARKTMECMYILRVTVASRSSPDILPSSLKSFAVPKGIKGLRLGTTGLGLMLAFCSAVV